MADQTADQPLAGAPETEPDAAPAKRSPLKNPRVRRIAIVVAIVLAVVGIWWFVQYWTVGRFMQGTDDAYLQADAVVVAPKVAGYVEEIFVAENQQVEKGDPLFRIDPRDYQSQVARAQAEIDTASANAASVRAQIEEQQAAISSAQARLKSAQADLAFARSEEQRFAPLAESGAEPRQVYAEKRTARERAEAAVAAAQADVASAQRRVGSLQAQIGQARAQAEGGEASRSAANVDLGSTLVSASIAGRVGNKTVELGQFVQPGLRTMSIVPTHRIYVTANFKETQMGLIRPGQPVTVEVDALDGLELHGTVESISPGTGAEFSLLPPQNATGNFTKIVQRVPVRIAIDASDKVRELLVPGLSVDVTVDTRGAKGSLDNIEARGQD